MDAAADKTHIGQELIGAVRVFARVVAERVAWMGAFCHVRSDVRLRRGRVLSVRKHFRGSIVQEGAASEIPSVERTIIEAVIEDFKRLVVKSPGFEG